MTEKRKLEEGLEFNSEEEEIEQPFGLDLVTKWLKDIDGLDDSQELNIKETSHNSGASTEHKITVGELKAQLGKEIDKIGDKSRFTLNIDFSDGEGVDLGYHDYYEMEIVTPEIKANEEKEEEILQDIRELKKLGIPGDVFLTPKGYGGMNSYEEPPRAFTPEDILKFGKIIEEWKQDKER
jgi:hypothetical protein